MPECGYVDWMSLLLFLFLFSFSNISKRIPLMRLVNVDVALREPITWYTRWPKSVTSLITWSVRLKAGLEAVVHGTCCPDLEARIAASVSDGHHYSKHHPSSVVGASTFSHFSTRTNVSHHGSRAGVVLHGELGEKNTLKTRRRRKNIQMFKWRFSVASSSPNAVNDCAITNHRPVTQTFQ